MRRAASALCVLSLAACAAVPVPPIPTTPAASDPAALIPAITTELPSTARPQHYAISVTPDAQALTFSGHEAIDLTVFEPARTLVLNARHLTIGRALLTPSAGGSPIVMTVTLDEAREQAGFTAPGELAPGAYRLEIDYRGRINRQPSGLFALDYPDKRTGKPARGLFTQFEVPDAREFAPLFDEPAYKATFDLSAVVPRSQLAASNMPVLREEPLPGGLKRVTFATTPRMSSYLLFLAAGTFERLSTIASDGTAVGIVAPAGSGETARYALDSLAALVPFYDDYFGVRFPLPKLDNVAAPGQSQQFGAMENWGAILTFEKNLLLDPHSTSPDRKRYLYTAQAHEFAHQWFGDLVTMAWWDDLWLNEGFASWFETKATAHFNPDWYPLVDRVNGRERAMALDSLSSSHAIVVHIRTAHEADSAFDTISYSKGEAVIAMLEAYAGEAVWRDGIRRYIAAHAYGNAVTADLWRAQEQAGAVRVAAIADSFTRQPGVPLVTVRQRCERGMTELSLEQGEFRRNGREAAAPAPRRWLVPLNLRAADGSFHRQLLDGTARAALPGCGPAIVNGGQLGYFRTLYTPADLAALAKALPGLEPIEQSGLVQDSLALAAAGYQDYAPALDLLLAVPRGANPVVAKAAIAKWAELYAQLGVSPAQAPFIARVHRSWYGRLEQLGFDPRPDESVADADLRAALLTTFGAMADSAVVAEAHRRFARLRTDRTALDGPLKTAWLSIAASNATVEDWNLLRSLGQSSTTSIEHTDFYSQLGNAVDDALAQRALDLALIAEPGATTSAAIVGAVARHHPDLAFDFALAHRPQIEAMLDDYSKADFIPRLLRTSTRPAMVAKLEALRAARPATEHKPIDEALAGLRQRLASGQRIRAQLEAWLAAR
ncbi:MAG: M1 family metallopeptidase [Croceibacterium sp.]